MAFFGELYLRTTRPFLAPEATAREATFIARTLGLSGRTRALDVGCGHGRHLALLLASGVDAWGADLDALSLGQLPGEVRRRVVRADMYRLPFGPTFRAVYAWYATLFISDDEAQNQAALAEAARVLAPGGALLVHGHNPIAQARDSESLFKATLPDGAELVEETWYDPARNILHGRRTLRDGERALEGSFLVRCPTLDDHRRWARALDLELDVAFGDPSGNPYAPESPDLIVLLRKR